MLFSLHDLQNKFSLKHISVGENTFLITIDCMTETLKLKKTINYWFISNDTTVIVRHILLLNVDSPVF